MEKRKIKSYGFMSHDTLEMVVRRAFDYADESCGFTFQGGEPTLSGLSFFQDFIKLTEKYNRNKIPVYHSIQTNGYHLDREWVRFFKENHFLVGISLDGNRRTHDACRVNYKGEGTFHEIMKTIQLLKEYEAEYNILTVVNGKTAPAVRKIYSFYAKNGLMYQQYIPCLNPIGEEPGRREYALTPKVYGSFLVELFELWYEDLMQGRQPYIRQFENYISILMGFPAESCDLRGGCSIQYVTEADGSVYPCDFYVSEEYKLGNFKTDSVEQINENEKTAAFLNSMAGKTEKCRECEYLYLCHGGCKRHWYESENYFCEAYKQFFRAALPRMRQIAGQLLAGKHQRKKEREERK
jgi:uncharacterized protein